MVARRGRRRGPGLPLRCDDEVGVEAERKAERKMKNAARDERDGSRGRQRARERITFQGR